MSNLRSDAVPREIIFELILDDPHPEYPALYLETLRENHESGQDPEALLYALRLCFAAQLHTPPWVQAATRSALNSWGAGAVNTLDKAFGIEPKRGRPAEKEQKKLAVYRAIRAQQSELQGERLTVWDDVGEKFSISGSLAKEWYYEIHNAVMNGTGLGVLPSN